MRIKQIPDALDLRILDELRRDARASFNELARRLGSSTPTVSYRVRRLQEVGIIRGFTVETVESARRGPEPAKDHAWTCANCKGSIRGQGFVRTFGKRFYAFCCQVCLDTFTKRFRRVSNNNRRAHPPRGAPA